MITSVALIHPSGQWKEAPLNERLAVLREQLKFDYFEAQTDPQWTWTAGNPKQRLAQLEKVLGSDKYKYIWCARGGYGATDLLGLIDFDRLKQRKEKVIVGFSDISALQSAFFTQLGWRSLHAPMPLNSLWVNPHNEEQKSLLKFFKGEQAILTCRLRPLSEKTTTSSEAWLFGGCLSVLTSLIGTPFLPKSFEGAVLFFEDIGENRGQILRMLRQWQAAKLFQNVEALIFGNFSKGDSAEEMLAFWQVVKMSFSYLFTCRSRSAT